MGKTITCDVCHKAFVMSDRLIKNRLSNGILFTFLQCPHCEGAFLISATDEGFRKRLRQRANGMRRNKKVAYMDQSEIRRLSDEQREKYRPRFNELFPNAWKKVPDNEPT